MSNWIFLQTIIHAALTVPTWEVKAWFCGHPVTGGDPPATALTITTSPSC